MRQSRDITVLIQILLDNLDNLFEDGCIGLCACTDELTRSSRGRKLNFQEEEKLDQLWMDLQSIDFAGFKWEPGAVEPRREFLQNKLKELS